MLASSEVEEDIATIADSGLFDVEWYLKICTNPGDARPDPLRHYVLRGEFEGLQPCQDLTLDPYRGSAGTELIGTRSPLAHYIKHSNPGLQIDLIRRSGLFDRVWYLEQNADVREHAIDPIRHYVFYGAKEGRTPNPELDLAPYTQKTLTLTGIAQNPLVNYMLSESLDSNTRIITHSGLFDSAWYLEKNVDVRSSGAAPLRHYILYGEQEGRRPNKSLNLKQYTYNAGLTPGKCRLVHYILFGTPDKLIDPGLLTMFSLKTLELAMDRLTRLPLFKPEDYLELNNDVAKAVKTDTADPVNHALTHGFPEGRKVFKPLRVAQVLGDSTRRPFPVLPAQARQAGVHAPVGVLYNAAGNVFIKELAQELVDALRFIGAEARLYDDQSEPDELPATTIITAPHEFFHIGHGPKWVTDEIVRNAFMYNTEQPQTIWFERAVPFILASRGVVDICYQIADIFRQCGLPALHFNPNALPSDEWLYPEDLSHPFYRVLPKAAWSRPDPSTPITQRPLTVAFFGATSRRREMFFARSAQFLANYENFIYYRKFTGPLTANARDGILSRIGRHVTAHAKISLNIHRDDLGFFEWHRLVKLGMLGGSIVVTEPCLPHPVFKPGVHFLEEAARHMPDLIEWLVDSPDGQAHAAKIQENVLRITEPRFALENSGALSEFLQNGGAGA
jgi:hypothetical protein